MKKVFISILAAAMSLSAFAAETAKVTIRLTSSNATYGNDELELKENSDRNASYESGYDAEKMMSQANKYSVLLYAFVGDQPCSTVATNNLDNLALGFTTNKNDVDYKLVFSNVSGRELKLYDKVENKEIVIANSAEYPFTAAAGRVAVNDRFVINPIVEPSLCFNYNVLEINGHAGESLVVKKGEAEIVSIDALPLFYSKDLSDQKGRLVVTLDGKDFQIDANPDVTPAN